MAYFQFFKQLMQKRLEQKPASTGAQTFVQLNLKTTPNKHLKALELTKSASQPNDADDDAAVADKGSAIGIEQMLQTVSARLGELVPTFDQLATAEQSANESGATQDATSAAAAEKQGDSKTQDDTDTAAAVNQGDEKTQDTAAGEKTESTAIPSLFDAEAYQTTAEGLVDQVANYKVKSSMLKTRQNFKKRQDLIENLQVRLENFELNIKVNLKPKPSQSRSRSQN